MPDKTFKTPAAAGRLVLSVPGRSGAAPAAPKAGFDASALKSHGKVWGVSKHAPVLRAKLIPGKLQGR